MHSTQSLKIPDSGLYAQKVADLKTCQAIVKLLFFLSQNEGESSQCLHSTEGNYGAMELQKY